MFLFLLLALVILAVCFGAWLFSPDFLSIGFYIYHVYPMILGIIAIARRKWARKKQPNVMKVLVLILPFIIWLYGVYWIFTTQQQVYL